MADPPSQHSPEPLVSSLWTRSLLAGALAGITVDFSLYPLDTLKTRLQSNLTSQRAVQNASEILPRHTLTGTLRSMYAGLPSAMLGSMPSAASFFVVYDGLKRTLIVPGQTSERNKAYVHMLASSAGEIAACVIRVPTEVVKQRAQAGLLGGSSRAALLDILSLRRTNGYLTVVRELYRGGAVTIMREIPFTIIQFTLWERFKTAHIARRKNKSSQARSSRTDTTISGSKENEISALVSAGYGSLSGAIAAGCTTPLDVLKTRIMIERRETVESQSRRKGALGLLRQILATDGPKGLFRGFVPRVGWISTGGAIFLGTYQWAWNTLGGQTQTKEDGEVEGQPL